MTNISDLQGAFPLSKMGLSEEVTLRPLVLSDLDGMCSFLEGDAEMSWSRTPWTIENVSYLLAHRLRHYEDFGFGPYGVISEGGLVGMAGAQIWKEEESSVEVLVYLARDHWGRGLATELLTWSISRLKEFTNQEIVYASTRPENVRAVKMITNLGFEMIGRDTHFGHDAILWAKDL